MVTSPKKVWLARLTALLLMSLGMYFLNTITEDKIDYTKKVEIKAKGNVGEIINTVEQLGRNDLSIKVRDKVWFEKKPEFALQSLAYFLSFGFPLGVYYIIYLIVTSLFTRVQSYKKPNPSGITT